MSGAHLFVIGVTHNQAPVEVRERLAPASHEALRADLAAVAGLREFAVLSTCNRIEFYGVGADGSAADSVQAAYCARQNFRPAEFERIRFRLSGREAALHLFEVASGLDSQMLGENEILGQVKDAYAAAHSGGSTGAVLNRVFQKAFQAAKHVRTHTAISSGQVSVASVAVDLAASIFGRLDGARVLVLGTGEIGEATARAFRSRGAGDLAVAGRRRERAEEIASGLGAGVLHFDERHSRLADYDIVVCSTAAPDTVLSASAISAAMSARPARPLLLIDLALPRDVEGSAARLQNVFLYNLDDLARIAEQNRSARQADVTRCRAILSERADGLWRSVQGRLSGGDLADGAAPRQGAGQAAAP
ncbi:MAG TPA: glutamyl-tRNA reductase [Opitutaceae bacterium]|nr:glutamyl-tRNA reductase [Opitutaceae bacterium]